MAYRQWFATNSGIGASCTALQQGLPTACQHLECIHDRTGLQHVLDAATDELSATSSNDRAVVDQKSGIRRLTVLGCAVAEL